MENRINKFHKRCLRLAFDELQDLSFSYLLLKDKNVTPHPKKIFKTSLQSKARDFTRTNFRFIPFFTVII